MLSAGPSKFLQHAVTSLDPLTLAKAGPPPSRAWFRVGRRLGFHSWAGALLTHCFCSSAGKPRLPGALDPRTEGLIWPPSWVGLSFSTLGRSPQKGAGAWLRPLYLGVPERFSVARQAC